MLTAKGASGATVGGWPGRAEVQAEGHPCVLRRAEHRVPPVRVERRQAERERVLRERDGARALRRAPLDLGGRQCGVPQGQDHERNQAIRRVAAPLVEDEVVVGLDTAASEFPVLRLQEDRPCELRKRGKAELGGHPVDVHVRDAGLGVVAARQDLVEAVGLETEVGAIAAGDGVEGDLGVGPSLETPDVRGPSTIGCAVGHLFDDGRSGFAQGGRQPLGPHVRVLHDVVVGGDQLHVVLQRHVPTLA